MTSSEVAVKDEGNLPISPDELAALQAAQNQEYGDIQFQTPILKIGQALTKEVQAEQAEAGEFINSLTGEGLGDKIEFIVAYYQPGRFASDRDSGRAYTAFGDTIPAHWEPLVGEQFVGTRFDEYPDAEETYKERVNNKEIQWGNGPLVSTTHNFTGLAIPSPLEGEDAAEPQLVRLSLKRADMPSVRKWTTLLRSLRNRSAWDVVFNLGTEKKSFTKGHSYILTVAMGRTSTPDERLQAVELAQAVYAGRVADNAATAEASDRATEAPEAKGGLGV